MKELQKEMTREELSELLKEERRKTDDLHMQLRENRGLYHHVYEDRAKIKQEKADAENALKITRDLVDVLKRQLELLNEQNVNLQNQLVKVTELHEFSFKKLLAQYEEKER